MILVFIVRADPDQVLALRILLKGFVTCSGLSVNFSISSVIYFDGGPYRSSLLTGCQSTFLPLQYLWPSTSTRVLPKFAWYKLIDEDVSCRSSWNNKLTIGGGLILVNAVLSAFQIIMCPIFGVVFNHNDSLHRSFFRQSSREHSRMHLCNWSILCRSKGQGGCGILELRNLNLVA